jgi:hypothetical protein
MKGGAGVRPVRPDRIQELPLSSLRPSLQNDKLYRPVSPKDPEVRELAASIRKHGVKEPLVVSRDGVILSGHRRHVAARLAGLKTVPCRTEDIVSSDPGFLPLLREYNRQRVKGRDEVLREEVVSADPVEAHRLLVEHRRRAARVSADTIPIEGRKHRARITEAKRPFLDAILAVLRERRDYWPLTDRQIHYALLNNPPLVHASKRDSRYTNTVQCYKSLCELLTRARLAGDVSFSAIHDPTRPVTLWRCYAQPAPYLREQLDGFLKGYYRDLQQSQPNHIEIVGEKNTIDSIIRPVAMEYCIPLTIGRGYSSLPPRHEMAQRFRRSGKEKLILLALSDFDPEGEDIAHSFARSMRDDFGVRNIVPVKVALTYQQVGDLELPPAMKAKAGSSRRKKFVAEHGDDVYELEAVPPLRLQEILRETVDSVLDVDSFNAEVEAEKADAAYLDGVRRTAADVLAGLGAGEPEQGGEEE